MQMQTDISQDEDGVVLVKLAGRFTLGDMSVADSQINQWIESQGARKLIFDMTGITHMDSAGLALIVRMNGKLQGLGGQLRLAGPNPRVMHVFRMTCTDGILQIDPDLPSSVDKLKE